ncbi:MAG: COG1361 S-layer family protein [Candidatus Nanohaloarchaea archaeon]
MKTKIVVLIFLTALISGLATAQGQSSNLEMQVLDTEPAPLQAGEYADIWIRVTNTGSAEASDPVFTVQDNYPFTPTDRTEWEVDGGLGTGESYTMRAQVKVDENAVFGNNSLKVEKSASGGSTSVEESIPLQVRTDDRSLVVSDLDFPERVEPGSSEELSMELENLAESNFRNIDVSLDTSELPVAARETSRKRISSVGPDSSEEVNFTLDVDSDADNELRDLPISIDYQDQAGNELSMSETTGVFIGGYPNIDVGIDDSDIRSTGSGTVTLQVLNRGEGEARFAEVQMEESDQYEIISEDSIYLGSMIADDYQTAEFELYVEDFEDGSLDMPVTVDYRDGQGDQTEEFDVERTLYSEDELSRYGLSQSGNVLIPVVVALALVGGGVYYWRKRKKE